MIKKKSSYEGLQGNIRTLAVPVIEVWKNQYPENRYTVHIDIPEFTCICPKTGMPDFATVTIEYIPRLYCVELKSLKEYMMSFRDIGVFHEHFTNKVMDDFVKACRPRWMKITTKFNPRGGITTTVIREYKQR